MVLSVRRLSEPLGAEITGIDLRQPISDAIKTALQQALLDHHFIVVPGQELNDLQSKMFGLTEQQQEIRQNILIWTEKGRSSDISIEKGISELIQIFKHSREKIINNY